MALKQQHIGLDKKATNDIKMGLTPAGTWHTPQNTTRYVFEIQTGDKHTNAKRASLPVSYTHLTLPTNREV